jgi:hypothetical protein
LAIIHANAGGIDVGSESHFCRGAAGSG